MSRPYSRVELEKIARDFLREFWTDPPEIPVNIETIVEGGLGFQIIPDPHLRTRKVLGLNVREVQSGRWSVCIDDQLFDDEAKYRFTLGEEVGHYLLHREIIEQLKSEEEFLQKYEEISPVIQTLDRNARYLAAKILVPGPQFVEAIREIIPRKLGEMPPDLERVLSSALHELAGLYKVSWSVLRGRLIENDVLMDSWVRQQVRQARGQ